METRLDWLKWRQKGIGGSDAPIIMGVSPWRTILDLYADKTAEVVTEDTSNQYVKNRGNRMEPKVRQLFEDIIGEPFAPCLVEAEAYPFIRCSLDGRSSDKKSICEIKLSGREDWNVAMSGVVPAKYIPQCQHALMVSHAEVCYYLSYLYDKDENAPMLLDNLAVVRVHPDGSYMQGMLSKETEFWECVTKRKPPEPSSRDFKSLTGLTKVANEWKALNAQAEEIEARLDELRAQLVAAAEQKGHPRLMCAGIKMSKVTRIGNVNYSKIPELKGVDLDQYRNAGSEFWTLKVEDEKG